jgi:acyl carrier protein
MSNEQSADSFSPGGLTARLAAAPPRHRKDLLADFLQEQLGYVVGVDKAQIGRDDSLIDLGIDSLKAVEVKLYLEEELGIELGSSLLFDYPTLDALAGCLLQAIGLADPPPPATPQADRRAVAADDGEVEDELSEAQLAELLTSEIASLDAAREGSTR